MTIDRGAIGRELAPITLKIDEDRLRKFAFAIGETNPVYLSAEAARAAGHPSIPVPPTFTFGIHFEAPVPFGYLTGLGVELRAILHGSQRFRYHTMAYAGDELTLRSRIADIFDKKGGRLEFVVERGTVTNQHGDLVLDTETVIVVRNGSES